jgi:hypothetical protein
MCGVFALLWLNYVLEVWCCTVGARGTNKRARRAAPVSSPNLTNTRLYLSLQLSSHSRKV